MSQSILRADKSYTFSDYFELAYPTKDIVAEFDYHFKLQKLDLPRFPCSVGKVFTPRRSASSLMGLKRLKKSISLAFYKGLC